VHEVVELVDENEYVHESSEFTEEALFVTLAEKPAEEAPLLLRFGWGFGLWLRLGLGFWLAFWLWLWLGFWFRFWLGFWLGLWRGFWLWLGFWFRLLSQFRLWFGLLRCRFWLRFGLRRLEGELPCLVASKDPGAAAGPKLLEQGPRFIRFELDVARRVEPLDKLRSGAWVAANLQFLS